MDKFNGVMALYLILLFGIMSATLPVQSQELILKDTKVPWQGITFSFPEDVVIKETNLTFEKSLHIYPARREPFFLVIRKLPLASLSFPKDSWEKEIFWRGQNVEKSSLEKNGRSFTLYQADQVRNQNLLRGMLWIWTEKGANFWVWILFRKENPKLIDFFENGLFLNSIAWI